MEWREACLRSNTHECYGYNHNGELIVVKFALFKQPIISKNGIAGDSTFDLSSIGWAPVFSFDKNNLI